MYFLDFDSLVVCNNNYDLKILKNTLRYFYDLGVKKFILTYEVFPDSDSFHNITNQIKEYRENVTLFAKPRGALIRIVPMIKPYRGFSNYDFINRLRLSRTNKVFINAPLLQETTWFDPELNYFLYKQKFSPVFTGFEKNLLSRDHEFTERLFRIKNAAYCIDVNYMTLPYCRRYIRHAIRNELLIIPSISFRANAYTDLLQKYEAFRNDMGDSTYKLLCRRINKSTAQVFNFLS